MNYEPIVVSESESVYQLELMLEEGGDLEGIVRNALGVPMPNVTVFFGRVDEFLTRWTTVTNEQGEFFFESFPDSKQLVSAIHPQYAISEFEVPEIARRRIPIEISMTEGGVVKGVIKGSTGDSAVNLRVAIDLPKRHRLRRFYRTPNADGTYEFRRLPPGEANVRLDIERGRVLTRPVAVRENDVHIVDFNIPEASGAIEGIVTVNGESTRYLQVMARIATGDGEERYWTHVAPDGQYRLESVVPGTGTVTAYAGLQSGRKKELSFPIQVRHGESAIRRDFVFGE